jgi:hypothetical protein
LPENNGPTHELHPNMFIVNKDKFYFMFLTFYETLDQCIGESGKLYDEVQKEMNRNEYPEDYE